MPLLQAMGQTQTILPICSMYGIFTNICPKTTQMWLNIPYMEHMGYSLKFLTRVGGPPHRGFSRQTQQLSYDLWGIREGPALGYRKWLKIVWYNLFLTNGPQLHLANLTWLAREHPDFREY